MAITRHELTQRREALQDLQRYLAIIEAEHDDLLSRLQDFRRRYLEALGPLRRELDALEAQLHQATCLLSDALKRQGVELAQPSSPGSQPGAPLWPELPALPEAVPLPAEPTALMVDLPPPSLKTLYRRAAMRLHPDLAPEGPQRHQREQQMMQVNAAHASGDRGGLQRLLVAAGERPERVFGGPAEALRAWLGLCEHRVQGRMRIVKAQTKLLQSLQQHQLRVAIERAEVGGMRPLDIMAARLRSQIAERRQELYIGLRLQPDTQLAQDFVRQRNTRAQR